MGQEVWKGARTDDANARARKGKCKASTTRPSMCKRNGGGAYSGFQSDRRVVTDFAIQADIETLIRKHMPIFSPTQIIYSK
jgi:hypothetical protein